MIVRQLTSEDADAWAALRLEMLRNHPLVFGASVPADPGTLVEQIRTRLASEESAVFGAFDDAALLGVVGIRREPSSKERHKALIWGMYVTGSSRRSGAGDALLRAAIQLARTWPGVIQVHLAVSEFAPEARRLYDRHGFKEWGREPRATCWNSQFADEAHMVLNLEP